MQNSVQSLLHEYMLLLGSIMPDLTHDNGRRGEELKRGQGMGAVTLLRTQYPNAPVPQCHTTHSATAASCGPRFAPPPLHSP